MSFPYNTPISNTAHGNVQYTGGTVAPPMQYISPQLLMANPSRGYIQPTASQNDARRPSHSASSHSSSSSSARQPNTRQDDWGALAPGQVHQLSIDVPPTPQSLIDGSYQRANTLKEKDIVIYVPRRLDFSGTPSISSILFSVNGKPGPYIRDIAKAKVVLDGAFDQVLYSRAWKQTWFTIDWPGVESDMEALPCFDDKGKPTTRTIVAAHIGARLCQFFMNAQSGKLQWGPQKLDAVSKDWNLKDINYRDVRLMALNYYRKTWIPVLAFDMEYDE